MYFMTSKIRMPLIYLAALLLLTLWTSVTVTVGSASDERLIYKTCSTAEYSNGSEFNRNLEALLKRLVKRAGRTGFAASVEGEKKADRVWGRLQCRGDLSSADCAACSAEALKNISGPYCNNPLSFAIQLEHCFLRYQNSNFLSQLDTVEVTNAVKDPNITDTHFSDTVSSLLKDLSRKSPASPIKSAMGSSFVASSNLTIYGMEMCWRDMSRKDCKACLSKGVKGIVKSSFSESPSVQVFLGSCTLRYETYDFPKGTA